MGSWLAGRVNRAHALISHSKKYRVSARYRGGFSPLFSSSTCAKYAMRTERSSAEAAAAAAAAGGAVVAAETTNSRREQLIHRMYYERRGQKAIIIIISGPISPSVGRPAGGPAGRSVGRNTQHQTTYIRVQISWFSTNRSNPSRFKSACNAD